MLTRPISLPRPARRRSSRLRRADRPARPRPDDRGVRERAKRANVNQDAATYTCTCGFVFMAPVTTSVDCPHCGCAQAW